MPLKIDCISTLNGHSDYVWSVAFNHDDTKIVSGSRDTSIKIWNVKSGTCISTLNGHSTSVMSVAFNHDNTKIVSGSADESIKIWDMKRGTCISTLNGHSDRVYSVAFNHDNTKIVSGSGDNSIKIWDVKSGTCISTLNGHSNYVWSVAFNHDNTKIVSGSRDKSIKIWDVKSGTCISTLKGHSDAVYSVAFNHDNTKIVSGSWDKSIKIWDVKSGTCISTLKGHSDSVMSVAFNHDNTKIVSGSYDNSIKIWDVKSGTCISTLNGHSKAVYSVAFNHDNTKIVSGSLDTSIKIWQITDPSQNVQKQSSQVALPNTTTDNHINNDTNIFTNIKHVAVMTWLESLSLTEYYKNFTNDGYDDLEVISSIEKEDELKDLGITKKGHRKKLIQSIKTLSLNANTTSNNNNNTSTTSTTSNINTKYTMIQTLQSQIEEAWQQTTVDHIKTLLPPGREIIILSKEINKSGFLPITFAVWKGATVNVVYYLYSLNKQKSLSWKSNNANWNLLHYAAYFKRDHLLPLLIVLYSNTKVNSIHALNNKTNKGKTPLMLANEVKHQLSITHLAANSANKALETLSTTYPTIASKIKHDTKMKEQELLKKQEELEVVRAKQQEELLKAKQIAYEKARKEIENKRIEQELLKQEKELERQKEEIEKAKRDAIEQAKKDAAEKAEKARIEQLKEAMKAKEEQKRKEEQEKAAKEQVRLEMERKRLEMEREKQEKQDVENAKGAVKDWLSSLNLSMYYEIMMNEGYEDLNVIRMITTDTLTAIGITKPGHVAKLTQAIHILSNRFSTSTSSSTMGGVNSTSIIGSTSGKIVFNYNFQTRGRNLSKRDGVKVILANTNDAQNTPLIAKVTRSHTLEREASVLRLFKDKRGDSANDYIVKFYDYIPNYDNNGTHALVLERGVEHRGTLADRFTTIHDKQQFIQKVSVAYQLLEIGNFISECNIVWGDVKPGNFVSFNVNNEFKYKAIDFDSCFYSYNSNDTIMSNDSNTSTTKIPYNTEGMNADNLVTPGYIAPERAELMLNQNNKDDQDEEKKILLDSKQDVFIFGLILYRLFTGKEYFASELIANDEYKTILANPIFKAIFPSNLRHDVKKILKEMLQRNPDDRFTFQQILKHSIWSSEASIRMSVIVNKLSAVEQRILESIEDGFNRLEDSVNALGSKMESVFQLIINVQNSKYPYFCFCVPEAGKEESSGMFKWAENLKKNTLEKVGWKKYFRFFIVDEAPMLLPGKCKDFKKPPFGDGILVELPGTLLVKLAPYLYFITKMFAIAAKVGKYIPVAKTVVETINFDLVSESFKLVVGITGQMKKVNGYVTKIEQDMKTAETHKKLVPSHKDDTLPTVMAKEVMEQILGKGGFAEKDWNKLVKSGKIQKVYKKSNGSIHWVAMEHVNILAENGYGVDQRFSMMDDGNSSSSNNNNNNNNERKKMPREEAIKEYDLHVDKTSWKPDNSSNICSNCDSKFTFTKRRHHCRKCGELVCMKCSTQRVVIAAVDKNKPLRICDLCFSMKTWIEWKNLSI